MENKKFTIDRATWVRGSPSLGSGRGGVASLLNAQGNMCCLGHICSQLTPKEHLDGLDMPSEVEAEGLPEFLVTPNQWNEGVRDSDFSEMAQEINDEDIPDRLREELLHELAAKVGITLEFVGDYCDGEILETASSAYNKVTSFRWRVQSLWSTL